MIKFAEENLISYHLNSDSTEGRELRKKFNVRGIPSFVFVDDDGNEIDRIVGYMPPKEYLAEMTRIRNGINTIPDLVSQLKEDPDNADLLVNLAGKIEASSGLKAAMTYWEMVFALEGVEPELHSTAALKMALFHANENDDPETLVSFVNNETNTKVLPKAYEALRRFHAGAKDTLAEADTYQRYVDFMSGIQKETSGLLNGYAWRMTQLEQNLDNALERINQGIDMLTEEDDAKTRAQIIDTKGEVLWKLGRIDEAVAVMDECIALQPEDEYYKEQKAKFLATS